MTATKKTTTKTKKPRTVTVKKPVSLDLPRNPFIFEVLDLVSKQRTKAKKIEVLKRYEDPSLKAYLCDDCWGAIPHFTVKAPVIKHNHLKNTKRKSDWNWSTIALYTLGNICCLIVIGYYLWLK